MFRSLVGKEEAPVLLQRPALLTSAFIWAMMTVVVSGITWAAVAQIDQSVPVQGKLEPEEGSKEVKAPSGGVVREILVDSGDRVEKGQLLVTFDPTGEEADSESLQRNRSALQRQLDVLRSEQAGTDIGSLNSGGAVADLRRNRQVRIAENAYYRALLRGESPPAPSQASRLVQNRTAQLARVEQLRSQRRELTQDLADVRVQIDALQVRLRQNQQRLAINEGIVADLRPLVEEGAIPELQFKQQQQTVLSNAESVTNIEGQIASLRERQGRLRASIRGQEAEIRSAEASWAADIENRIAVNDQAIADLDSQLARSSLSNRRDIAQVRGQNAQVEGQIIRAEQALRFQELRAPLAGRVFDIQASGPGYVANPTEPILSIVPDGDLIASVYVTNKDIGFIRTGMPVEVNIDSFPSLEFGSIDGELVSIGSDALAPTQEIPTYHFPLKIKLDSQSLVTNNGNEFDIQAGMSVSARIKTRKRSVLDIFLGQFKSRADSFETVR